MDSSEQGGRALPPPLVVGLGMAAVELALTIVMDVNGAKPSFAMYAVASLFGVGEWLTVYGLWRLADRHAGAVRRGLRVGAASKATMIALRMVIGLSVGFHAPWWRWPVMSVALPVLLLMTAGGAAIGLAVAVWRRRPALGAALVADAIASTACGMASGWLVFRLELGFPAVAMLRAGLAVIYLGVLIATVRALAGAPRDADPAGVGRDLRRTARALRAAVAVMIVVIAALVLLEWRGGGKTSADTAVWAATAGLSAVVFFWLGITLLGVAREREGAIAPYPITFVAVLSLACGGALLVVVPEVCTGGPGANESTNLALFGVPAAAALGAAVLAWTIAHFARRSGLDELRRRASRQAYSVVASVILTPLIVVKLVDVNGPAGVLFVVVVCVAQVVWLARLCVAAALAVEHRSELPEARLIRV